MKLFSHPLLTVSAFITRGTVIALRDFEGKVYYTVMHKTPFGDNVATVYWLTCTGHVICHDDGTTGGNSIYIKKWAKL